MTVPKIKTSIRSVDITAATAELLQAYLATLPSAPDSWLFPSNTTDGPLHPDSLDDLVSPAFQGAEAPGKLHSLRHSDASLLIANGESAKYISWQLGHASIQITMNPYGHLFKRTRQEAMNRLDAVMEGGASAAPDRSADGTPALAAAHTTPAADARPALRVIAGGRR